LIHRAKGFPIVLRKPIELVTYLVRHLLNLPYTARLFWLMLRHRVDIVQLNNGLGDANLALPAFLLRKPTVGFFRGYWPIGRLQRYVFEPRVRKFVAVSRYIADQAIADGISAEKVVVATPPVIPEPVSEDRIAEARSRHGLTQSQKVVASVGRVVGWKGQREFVLAAERILERFPGAVALIVGDATPGDAHYLDSVRELVEGRGLADRIIFTGYREDVATYYELADVVVHTAVEPEPSGRVLFEALSHGTPVVVSDRGGPKEFVEDGVDGFVVDPTDTGLVAERVGALLEDEERRLRMGERGREKILRLYGAESYARAVETIYEEVADPSRR
jgi:glycosyltransferase involved in cell wall biosynthesis